MCTISDQLETTGRQRVQWGPRHREDLPPPDPVPRRAVMSDPLSAAASITATPRDSPEMMRLRRGKLCVRGAVPGRNSDTSAPCSRMRRNSGWLMAG